MEDSAYAHFKIIEVAYECGFNSKAAFNRAFKKITGKSPSAYKKDVG
jgi:AraC-like DNA-binding protein